MRSCSLLFHHRRQGRVGGLGEHHAVAAVSLDRLLRRGREGVGFYGQALGGQVAAAHDLVNLRL